MDLARFSLHPGDRVSGTAETARLAVLIADAGNVGTTWARSIMKSTLDEGRAVDGGWPGTLIEARARISAEIDRRLSSQGKPRLTTSELAATAAAAYAAARQAWLEAARHVRRRKDPADSPR